MSRWFRHYAGMMRDEKLVRAAVKSKQPVERVVWVWGAILESASEINDAGRYDFDAEEAAYFLRCDPGDVASIVDALEALDRLNAGCVAKWGDRQFDSDASRERQKRYRDRLKPSPDNNGDVTTPSPDAEVTPQETETEADTKTETEDKSPPPVSVALGARDLFDEIWETFPQNPSSSESAAKHAFDALSAKDQAKLLDAVRRHALWFAEECTSRKRTPDAGKRYVSHLSTWISGNGWREADALRLKSDAAAPVVPMIRLDRERDHDLWLECERIIGKPAPTSGMEWSFRAEVVDQARSSLGVPA